MLVERVFALLASAPLDAIRALAFLRQGKAALKSRIAREAPLDLTHLPWNDDVLDFIVAERKRGRRVYLASAADSKLVDAVAADLNLFDGTFASDGKTNLSGREKACALCEAFGAGGFDYAGDARADMDVWEQARHVLIVNARPRLVREVRAKWSDARIIGDERPNWRKYVSAIRVHQWLKNLLIFLPMLAAHNVTVRDGAACLIGFWSFSLCASSVYVMNDLVDLGRDRAHATKRNRPFAAGAIPVQHGLAIVPLLMACSALLALLPPPKFLGVVCLYYVLTVAYSLVLKRHMMIDVVMLACLYGLRLWAGGAATDVPLSAWLAAFSIFFFTGLALVKRCTELTERLAAGKSDPVGRAYRLTDLPMLEGLASASCFTAVLVYVLYVNSDAVVRLYSHPKWLLLVCVVLVYWLGRVLLLMHRNEMKDDPVVFAATDRISQICGAIAAAIIFASV